MDISNIFRFARAQLFDYKANSFLDFFVILTTIIL